MRRIVTILAVAFALIVCAARSVAQAEPKSEGFKIIVHPSNPVVRLDRKFIADVFLKKVTRWSGDRVVVPVDHTPGSAVRKAFSNEVLKRSVAAVKSYWQPIIFSGRGVPPPELDGDAAVVRFVVEHPAAIGYLSPTADVGTARVVVVK